MRKITHITSLSVIAYRRLLQTDVRTTSNLGGEPKRSAEGSKAPGDLLTALVEDADEYDLWARSLSAG